MGVIRTLPGYALRGKALYRLPYKGKDGRYWGLRKLTKTANSSPGWWVVRRGKREFWSVAKMEAHMVKT